MVLGTSQTLGVCCWYWNVFGMLARIYFKIHSEKPLYIPSWKNLYIPLCFPPHIIFPMVVKKAGKFQSGSIVLPQVLQCYIFNS